MNRGPLRAFALSVLVVACVSPAPAATVGQSVEGVVSILGVRMADAHCLRIEISATGLEARPGELPILTLSVGLGVAPVTVTLPLVHMSRRFAVDLDLQAGEVRVGSVSVGAFTPVPRFAENMRFPVEATVRRGPETATVRRTVTLLLPTVIVPGYLNESGGPNADMLATLRRHGYADAGAGASPTLFWFSYPSRGIGLQEGAQSLAAYVRQVVFPATYAAKINVIGYSLGGLLARWNVAYNVDGWDTLVNRLILVGVPNEGAVMTYLGQHAPTFLPFSGLGKSPVAPALLPTFPFWRSKPKDAWSFPPDAVNPMLDQLNARPIPSGIRVYLFYGDYDPHDPAGPVTLSGITGILPGAELLFAAGDGIVLAASAQGLPIHGGTGVPALADRAVLQVDLGAAYHLGLLAVAADRIAAALLDGVSAAAPEHPGGNGPDALVGLVPGQVGLPVRPLASRGSSR